MGSFPSANSAPAASHQLASEAGPCDPPAIPELNQTFLQNTID